MDRPSRIMIVGRPGAGKSTLARKIGGQSCARRVGEEGALVGVPVVTRLDLGFEGGGGRLAAPPLGGLASVGHAQVDAGFDPVHERNGNVEILPQSGFEKAPHISGAGVGLGDQGVACDRAAVPVEAGGGFGFARRRASAISSPLAQYHWRRSAPVWRVSIGERAGLVIGAG